MAYSSGKQSPAISSQNAQSFWELYGILQKHSIHDLISSSGTHLNS